MVFLFLATALVAVGRGKKDEPVETEIKTETQVVEAKKNTYAWVCVVSQIAYFIDHRIGLELGGLTLGAETKFLGPTDYDLPGMIDDMEQLIGERVDGLLPIALDPSLKPVIDKAVDAGIPVVNLDADVSDSKRMAFVGTNNYQFGVEGAKLMATALNEKGKVAIIQIVGQTNLNERAQGFKDHMADNHPGIEIVGTIDDKGDQVVAANATRAFLQANPDIDGIISVDERRWATRTRSF
jgi:ribose transport system substrate-binding protein